MIKKGKITNLCALISETTDLFKLLQIYGRFLRSMQCLGKSCKSMQIDEQKLQLYAKYYKSMLDEL